MEIIAMTAAAPVPGRPDETEYTSWAKAYVDAVEGSGISEILVRQREDYLSLLRSLDGDYAYAPGKWTVKEIAGHVNDAERIFAYRLLCVARGDLTPFPPFEQDDYIAPAAFHLRSLGDLADEFEAVRGATICLVKSLPLDAWLRRGTVSGCSVTPRGLAFQLAEHERHHARILLEKYRP